MKIKLYFEWKNCRVTPQSFFDKLIVSQLVSSSPDILMNPKKKLHKSAQLVPVLSQMNTIHTVLPYFHSDSILIRTSFMSSTPLSIAGLDLIILISFGEEYKYGASHDTTFSSLLSFHPAKIHIFSSKPCYYISPSCVLPLMCDRVSHSKNPQAKYVYFSFILIFRFERAVGNRNNS